LKNQKGGGKMNIKPSVGVEIERKYIIAMPDVSVLSQQSEYSRSEILQIYLPSESGETHRIRRRKYADKIVCTETKKIRIDKMSSTEIEAEISAEEFLSLAKNPAENCSPIEKTRHTFLYDGQLFEIDVYPEWKFTAIMETELKSRQAEVKIPEFLTILREVTGNKAYSNAGMSRAFPEEIIKMP
jgi:CYTH domain-containing protein